MIVESTARYKCSGCGKIIQTISKKRRGAACLWPPYPTGWRPDPPASLTDYCPACVVAMDTAKAKALTRRRALQRAKK